MRALKQLILPVFIISIYLVVCRFDLVSSYLVPRPQKIAGALLLMLRDGSLAHHIAVSFQRVCKGFLITTGVAVPLALLFYFIPPISRYFLGSLHFLRSIPPLAMVPLLILWFGIGEASKLAIIILASFFPVFLNTLSGLQQVDPKLLEMGRTLELGRGEQIINILLPESLPTVLTGLRLAFGYSWRALIGAEMIAASSGLGYMILDAEELARTDKVYIGILTIGTLGLLLDIVSMKYLQWKFPWMKSEAS